MKYTYRPWRFFLTVFVLTWLFWIAAAVVSRTPTGAGASMALMLLGLFVPSATAIVTVLKSKSAALKLDFRQKLFGAFRVRPLVVLRAIAVFAGVIAASILLSTLVGESLNQFAFVEDFSFSIGGVSTLLTLVLTALLEELGWRGYAKDAIASYCSWWKASIIFGAVWAMWHLPLFGIAGTYQNIIMSQNPLYAASFIVGIIPMSFLFTWVYVKNNRSIFACMIFHFFVNLLQEQIAMTQITKCVETVVLYAVAVVVVACNKELFFDTKHVGNLLQETEQQGGRHYV